MAEQQPRPRYINRDLSNIGVTPFSSHAETLRANGVYLRNQIGHGQVYTYSGPGPGTYDAYNPDYDHYDKNGVHAEHVIILHSPPKADTSNPARQLAGVLLPWRSVPGFEEGRYCDRPAKISWKHLYNGETVFRQLYRSRHAWPDNWSDASRFSAVDQSGQIQLFDDRMSTLAVDWDMRYDLSTEFWQAGNSATLSKDTSTYVAGTQSLKVARNGVNNPYAEGPFNNYLKEMVVGADYHLNIWVRSDGNATPTIKCGGDTLATGTTSTDWQLLTADFTADSDVLRLEATTSTGTEACWFDGVYLHEDGYFRYQPDASGEFTAGILRVERIKIAALSVFHAPDTALTDDQAVVTRSDVAPGRAIRGYTGTGTGSIGDMEYMAGAGGAAYNIDDVERGTRRALICSGHPMGLSTTESSSYYNIRSGDASYFRVTPRNLTGKSSGNVSTIPMLYGYCQGAAVGNEAYVKYTALTSGDTWEYEINSDTPGLWGDMSTLEVDADEDAVKIEFKAPPDGWLVCKSYYLWEDSYDS